MKNKKWISLAAAVILAVTALPMTAFAAEKDGGEEKLTKVTLNEVAHSIFYAPQYVAIEEGYFSEEGLDLTLITGFGADKVLTALISGEADIGFMGAESSIYAYQEGATDPVVNFAQLTQRAGNFLVAREEMPDFKWEDLKGRKVLGGRKGGMPEMVFEYILKQIDIVTTYRFHDRTFRLTGTETCCLDRYQIGISLITLKCKRIKLFVAALFTPLYQPFIYFFTQILTADQRDQTKSAHRKCS